jgi:hypothetical protein
MFESGARRSARGTQSSEVNIFIEGQSKFEMEEGEEPYTTRANSHGSDEARMQAKLRKFAGESVRWSAMRARATALRENARMSLAARSAGVKLSQRCNAAFGPRENACVKWQLAYHRW